MKIKCNIIYGIIKYGVFPPRVDQTLKSFAGMADLGIKYVDFDVTEETITEHMEASKEISDLCNKQSLVIENVTAYLPQLFSPDNTCRRRSMRAFMKTINLASRLGADMVMTDSFPPPITIEDSQLMVDELVSAETPRKVFVDKEFSWDRFWRTVTHQMRKCNEAAERAGRRFCVEPIPGDVVSNTDAMLRLMDAVDSDNFGAVLDTATAHYQREIIPLSIAKLGRQLFMVHTSDNDGIRNRHLVPGKGSIDWNTVMRSLKLAGFDGCVAIDVRGRRESIDFEYRQAKAFLEDLLSAK